MRGVLGTRLAVTPARLSTRHSARKRAPAMYREYCGRVVEREAALVCDGLECFEAGDDHEHVDGTLRRPVQGEFVARVEARDELGDCCAARIEVGGLEHRGRVGVAARGLEDRPSPGLGVVEETGRSPARNRPARPERFPGDARDGRGRCRAGRRSTRPALRAGRPCAGNGRRR